MRRDVPDSRRGGGVAVLWEVITAGLRWLPMPYFPGPAGVLAEPAGDRALLFDSTWHSLLLLLGGYALGVLAGWSRAFASAGLRRRATGACRC